MTTLLCIDDLARALRLRDLSDPAQGRHAMQALLDDLVRALSGMWGCAVDIQRRRALMSVEDSYDRLGYHPADITCDARYSRYVAETVMLRSHTTAAIPAALRDLARQPDPPRDVLLVLPGLCYRRDSIDRLHVGTPHQLDLWRITTRPMTGEDLQAMVGVLVQAVLPGARWRTVPAVHPYTVGGLLLDVETDAGWVELAECGLAAPAVLTGGGLVAAHGLAPGMGLDRAVMLRKGLPDIRLLRSTDPRIAGQMHDLSPWRPVLMLPPVHRDLSIAVSAEMDEELLGDAVRVALGDAADDLESATVLATTPYHALPRAARERLGIRPGQLNLLLRLMLRPLARTLTDLEANALRDRVYAALHEGAAHQWAAR